MKTKPQNDYKKIYIDWLTKKIDQVEISEKIQRITLPFLDRNNDQIELYIINEGNDLYTITDDSSTINELEFSGVDVCGSPKRKNLLISLVNSHGVELTDSNELLVRCNIDNLPLKKHMLTQCIIKISDLYYLSKSNVQSLFVEDVRNFLLDNDIQFTPDVSFVGKSKLTTHYDFSIGQTRKKPTRIITAVNNLDNNLARNIIFNWSDTKEARKYEMELYTFIQDTDKKIKKDPVTALNEYGISTVPWSKRNDFLPELIM